MKKMRIQKLITEANEQVHLIWHNLGYLYRFLIFITPFLTIALYFVFVLDYLDSDSAQKYGISAFLYLFPPLGKESIIPLMLSSSESLSPPEWLSFLGKNIVGPSLPAWTAWSMVIAIDIISSAIIAYNWWFAELIITHIPFLDRGYTKLQTRAEKFRQRKLLTISLLLFMIIPFQGTGGISTTIISRAIGLNVQKTIAIVFIGSIITTTTWILWWLGFFTFF